MEFEAAKEKLYELMIRNILEYVRSGKTLEITPSSYMDAHTLVYNLSNTTQLNAQLLAYHNSIIEDFIKDCYEIIQKESTEQLIDTFISLTKNINILIYWMKKIFEYLERNCLKKQIKPNLFQISMNLYKKHFFDKIQRNIYIALNKLIKEDRNGNMEPRPKIKAILKVLYDMDLQTPIMKREKESINWDNTAVEDESNEQIYQDKWFFDYFKDETIKFVQNKANTDIHTMSAPEYINSQIKYLDEEEKRLNEYISPIYKFHINEINHKYLIGEKAEELSKMETGIPYMFNTKRNEELKKTFKLFKLYPDSLAVITNAFDPYIRRRGSEIQQNKEITKDPKIFIPELISLKKEMDNLVDECFENHTLFQDQKKKAFSTFMTKEIYSIQLSNYTDFCMRSGFKGKSAEEIENTLNDIIDLFKCLNSKLSFQLDSNKKMSDRLIKKVSLSTNTEKIFISKLKQEAGISYVNKMDDMMKDLEKNKKEIDDYKASPSKGAPNGIKLDVQVICQSAWNINKILMEKIEMPKFMTSCLEDFENFYLARHTSHKLMWCVGLSKLEVQFLYLKNKNIAISTLPQYLTLLHLETHGTKTISEIAELLGCNVNTVIKDIHGLVFNPSFNPKGQTEKGVIIGTFDPKEKYFKKTDTITINKNFTVSRQKFITLPQPVKKSDAETEENEKEEAQITRRYQDNIIQATLTRIMKSRIGQVTTHVWLINEASRQIDLFNAQPQQIKESIEKLIEKNIIKRDDHNKSNYEYIA